MNDNQNYPVIFVTGVGYLKRWCGVSESIYQIIKQMKNPPLVVTSGRNGITQRLRNENLPVINLAFPITIFQDFRTRSRLDKTQAVGLFLSHSYRLLKLFKLHQARVVYVSDVFAMILAFLPAKLSRAKLVIGIRGEPAFGPHWNLALRFSDRIVALSHDMARQLLEVCPLSLQKQIESKITVIYNGVDIALIQVKSDGAEAIRSRFGLNDQDIMVLYIGAFDLRKAQLAFIEQVLPQFFQQKQSSSNVHFVFVGGSKSDQDQDYEIACQQTALNAPFSQNIHFAGFQHNVWPWYAAADIVVLASKSEGMPRAVIEGMACGKPVISYAVTSVVELLQNTGAGIVISQGDVIGIAEGIARLANNMDLRKQMGEKGTLFASKHLDILSIAKSYQNLFAELM